MNRSTSMLPSSTPGRLKASALMLTLVYLTSGLLGNLHLILIDHHGSFAHGHSHAHHQATCPDAEWMPAEHCESHHELADHDVVAADTHRILTAGSSLAVLPGIVAHDDDDPDGGLIAAFTIPSLLVRITRSLPVRAPPADLLSV